MRARTVSNSWSASFGSIRRTLTACQAISVNTDNPSAAAASTEICDAATDSHTVWIGARVHAAARQLLAFERASQFVRERRAEARCVGIGRARFSLSQSFGSGRAR